MFVLLSVFTLLKLPNYTLQAIMDMKYAQKATRLGNYFMTAAPMLRCGKQHFKVPTLPKIAKRSLIVFKK